MATVQIEASLARFVQYELMQDMARRMTAAGMTITKHARLSALGSVASSAIMARSEAGRVRPSEGMLSAIGMAVNEQIRTVRAVAEAGAATVH